jgi:hypothetical protein
MPSWILAMLCYAHDQSLWAKIWPRVITGSETKDDYAGEAQQQFTAMLCFAVS